MRPALADACGASRCIFVVGKGGAGKTTSAGALAVLLAGDDDVRLISTDPAHSLGDLFGVTLPAGSGQGEDDAVRVCGRVALEAFDATAWAARWSAAVRPRLAEVIEAGTYLDASEVAGFLDLSLPGIDEVMAALRLAGLAGARERIVVDTAPTGHTLRLLEAADLIDGWIAPLRAMAAKGATVATHIAGTPLRLTGESALDELADAAHSFRRILADATFLVVEREDPAVRAETDRLLAWLAARELRVGAVLQVGPAPARARYRLIRMAAPEPGVEPCTALLAAARSSEAVQHPRDGRSGSGHAGSGAPAQVAAAPLEPAAQSHDAREFLLSLPQRMLLFAGKGGVGKSTCAAAVALGLADTRDVLLVSTDPAGSLADLLEVPVGGEAVRVRGGLRVRQIDAAALLRGARDRHREDVARVFERVGLAGDAMDRAVLESVWDLAPPGADEVMALIELTDAVNSDEVLVVDAAPTGHFLRLLEMPALVGDWTRALLRVLARYRTAVGLDDVTARILAFAKQLRTLQGRLRDAREAGVFVVTVDAPLVREETERLIASLARAGAHVTARVVNRAPDGERTATSASTANGGVPVFDAPEWTRPPQGADALAAFLDSWTRVA